MYGYGMENIGFSLVGFSFLFTINQKSHIATLFDHLDPGNVMVPLTMLLTIHYANDSTSGITRQTVMLHLILIVIDLKNAVVPLMMPSVSHNSNTDITLPKRSFCTFFQSS